MDRDSDTDGDGENCSTEYSQRCRRWFLSTKFHRAPEHLSLVQINSYGAKLPTQKIHFFTISSCSSRIHLDPDLHSISLHLTSQSSHVVDKNYTRG